VTISKRWAETEGGFFGFQRMFWEKSYWYSALFPEGILEAGEISTGQEHKKPGTLPRFLLLAEGRLLL
jgi:hypothetical protein